MTDRRLRGSTTPGNLTLREISITGLEVRPGLVGGLLPAIRAAKLQVATALRAVV